MGEARIKWIDRLYACEDAFEGSDIPTSRITPGLVREMREALEALFEFEPPQLLQREDEEPSEDDMDALKHRARIREARTLLARLKPETDDG